MRASIVVAVSIVLGGTAWGIAQTNHAGHTPGMEHAAQPSASPVVTNKAVLTEPGQGAFASLSEVVRVLEADPDTDWSKVDLAGLRDHLVDMDRLVSEAVVASEELPNGLRMVVTGDARTIGALQRMVPAHATELAKDDRWTVAVERSDEGAVLTVTSDDPAVVERIKGLGFFGLMASQDHHREHHMMMARGVAVHAH